MRIPKNLSVVVLRKAFSKPDFQWIITQYTQYSQKTISSEITDQMRRMFSKYCAGEMTMKEVCKRLKMDRYKVSRRFKLIENGD